MMVTLFSAGLSSVALASELPAPPPPPPPPGDEVDASSPPLERFVPLRSPLEAHWSQVDLRARALSRSGNWLAVTGLTAGALGAGLLLGGSEAGVLPLAAGVGGLLLGPPLALSGAARSARSLRLRGIRVSTVPVGLGWASYSLILLSPFAAQGALVLTPTLYLGAVVGAALQLRQNQRSRDHARLPLLSLALRPDKLALIGTF
ncbi:MAG TPA: hypothetical protein ENK18_06360 [Deltaproteobacteria bacterium]|nr:hypothetical protein [Deltaproteobacteria bacterium]